MEKVYPFKCPDVVFMNIKQLYYHLCKPLQYGKWSQFYILATIISNNVLKWVHFDNSRFSLHSENTPFQIPRLLHYDPKLSLKMSLLNWHSSSLKSFEYWEGLLSFSQGSPCLVLISSGNHWPVRPPSRTFTLKCSGNNFVLSISFGDGKNKNAWEHQFHGL